MSSVTYISSGEREQIRLGFYRAHRAQAGFSSVAVRRDAQRDVWYLDVGVTAAVDLPSSYRGLEVRVRTTRGAINAVTHLDHAI
jgi:hypothetical protein